MANCSPSIPDFEFNDRKSYESPADIKYIIDKVPSTRNKLLDKKPLRHKRDNKGLLESFFSVDLGLGI